MNKAKQLSTRIGYGTVLAVSGVHYGFAADPNCQKAEGGITGGVDCVTPDGAGNTTIFGDGGIFERIVNVLLFVTGAVSVIMLIVGGFRYVVSGGSEKAVGGAKNQILYAIIGLVVTFLAFAIVNFVTGQLTT